MEETGGADAPGLHAAVLPFDPGGDDDLVPPGAERPDFLEGHDRGPGLAFLLFLSRVDGDDVAIGTGAVMLDRVAGVGEAAAEEVDEEGLGAGAGRRGGRYGHGHGETPGRSKGKGNRTAESAEEFPEKPLHRPPPGIAFRSSPPPLRVAVRRQGLKKPMVFREVVVGTGKDKDHVGAAWLAVGNCRDNIVPPGQVRTRPQDRPGRHRPKRWPPGRQEILPCLVLRSYGIPFISVLFSFQILYDIPYMQDRFEIGKYRRTDPLHGYGNSLHRSLRLALGHPRGGQGNDRGTVSRRHRAVPHPSCSCVWDWDVHAARIHCHQPVRRHPVTPCTGPVVVRRHAPFVFFRNLPHHLKYC